MDKFHIVKTIVGRLVLEGHSGCDRLYGCHELFLYFLAWLLSTIWLLYHTKALFLPAANAQLRASRLAWSKENYHSHTSSSRGLNNGIESLLFNFFQLVHINIWTQWFQLVTDGFEEASLKASSYLLFPEPWWQRTATSVSPRCLDIRDLAILTMSFEMAAWSPHQRNEL